MSVWTQRYFCYSLGYNQYFMSIYFVSPKCSRFSQWELLKLDSYAFQDTLSRLFFFFLSTFLLSGTTRLMLYYPCLSLESDAFPASPSPFYWRKAFRSKMWMGAFTAATVSCMRNSSGQCWELEWCMLHSPTWAVFWIQNISDFRKGTCIT
jgi:hypothetical protein